MRRRAFTLTCALAAFAACGPVAGPPPIPLPINSCPEHACTAYAGAEASTCSGGICASNNTTFDFTLVVSLPESSYYEAGSTVPIASFAAAVQSSPCGAFQTGTPASILAATCFRIPPVVEPTGAMIVEQSVVNGVGANGAYIDTTGKDFQWSLPVQVQFRPFWPPTDPSLTPPPVYVEAASIGLPLDPVDATIFATPGAYPAPRGGEATGWRALVATGVYERDIIPQNDAFPVVTTPPFTPASNSSSTAITGLDTEANETFTVTRAGGSLDGFVVYLRDATTLRRVSSSVTLHGEAPGAITLATIGETPLWTKGESRVLQVVVAPPTGSATPYLADPIGATANGKDAILPQSFPALPEPIAVSGNVVAPDLAFTPVQASLVIDSAGTSITGGITLTNPHDSTAPYVHYSTAAQTDAHGHYAVTLPQGTYDVFVTPVEGSNAGSTSVPLVVGAPLGSLPPTATGKDLQAAPLGLLRGVATIADGRPLAGATVQAQAAVSLAATLDPRRWPRARTTTTDAKGAFSMHVDPGVYDVVVQPADGTGFPWTTVSSQVVAPGKALALAPMVIPLPQAINLVLHDPDDNPLIRPIVRAFAPASGATPATPGAPRPMIEIGSWMADTSGHLTMLLAPPH